MKNIITIPIVKFKIRAVNLKTILSVMFVFLSALSPAQKDIKESMIPPEKLRQDFQILRSSLEEGYPGMSMYQSKKNTDSIFDTSEKQIQNEMSEGDFFLFLSKIVMQLHDGHMDVFPTKNTLDKLEKNPCTIPFQAFISGQKMYVQKNYSTLSDKELLGAEIISINGQPVSSLIAEIMNICTSDGNNETNKYKRLEYSGLLTQYLFNLQGYTENYKIKYIPFNKNSAKNSILKGIVYENLLKIRKSKYPGVSQLPAEFKLLNLSTAYLKVKSFNKSDYKSSKMDFSALLKSSFETINSKGVKNLILDLRGNGGGTDEYGKILFSYFIDHEFTYYSSLLINKTKFSFVKYTDQPDLEIPEDAVKINDAGTYNVTDHPNLGVQKNSTPYYSGKLFILIDGNCFSTTSECLSMLHSYTSAVFIGEESGGGYYGNCSGSVPILTLPNSLLQIGIPLMKYSMAVKDYKYKDHGVIPDYNISPTIKDKMAGYDPELEFTKKLISPK
ncbi:C-terminal processing protease CtpA/Prc [Chryseobacterium sp. H1D6B]|uniref:S41 family peptidase n=1 Tax=Chryseobacterium sp. H1D6B TaxID=2940588 RepID=UPI0015CB8C9A|nr:S41 family peptidase [Chryseobacterium sp. H1D6B]MDH6253420.1 C-terminal processing protease CtpA/Prc [Chryseobacterium sp. H1D6B]